MGWDEMGWDGTEVKQKNTVSYLHEVKYYVLIKIQFQFTWVQRDQFCGLSHCPFSKGRLEFPCTISVELNWWNLQKMQSEK